MRNARFFVEFGAFPPRNEQEDCIMRKRLEDLTIQDDFIFGKVFGDTELAKQLIDVILPELHIKELNAVIRQRDLKNDHPAHGIRFDILAENDEYLFGVEMHNNRRTFSPRRTRFYRSSADMYLLEQGEDYDELKNQYIIIICTYDPFGHGRMIYRYENICRQTQEALNDGTCCIYINCQGQEEEPVPEIEAYCAYTMNGCVQNAFTEAVDREVQWGRKSPEWKREFMSFQLRMWEAEKAARAKGLAEGRAEGIAAGRAEGIAAGRAEGIAAGRAEGIAAGRAEGLAEGRKEGRAEGHAAGLAEGIAARNRELVQKQAAKGLSVEEIADLNDLLPETVREILFGSSE